jgi:hypothetical protein
MIELRESEEERIQQIGTRHSLLSLLLRITVLIDFDNDIFTMSRGVGRAE